MLARNHAKRLKTLRGLTPHEFVCAQWQNNPTGFTRDPTHFAMELYSLGPVQYAVPTAAWSRETPTVVDASSNQQCRFGMPYPSLLTMAIFRLCLTSRRRISISGQGRD